MTQTPIAPPGADDIVLEDDDLTHRLDRQADALIAEDEARSFRPVGSVRQAVRDDAHIIRERLADRVETTRDAIRDDPVRATLYALGVGVVLGMLLRR